MHVSLRRIVEGGRVFSGLWPVLPQARVHGACGPYRAATYPRSRPPWPVRCIQEAEVQRACFRCDCTQTGSPVTQVPMCRMENESNIAAFNMPVTHPRRPANAQRCRISASRRTPPTCMGLWSFSVSACQHPDQKLKGGDPPRP